MEERYVSTLFISVAQTLTTQANTAELEFLVNEASKALANKRRSTSLEFLPKAVYVQHPGFGFPQPGVNAYTPPTNGRSSSAIRPARAQSGEQEDSPPPVPVPGLAWQPLQPSKHQRHASGPPVSSKQFNVISIFIGDKEGSKAQLRRALIEAMMPFEAEKVFVPKVVEGSTERYATVVFDSPEKAGKVKIELEKTLYSEVVFGDKNPE